MGESATPYKDVSAKRHSREGGNPVCVLRQLKRCSTPSRFKPRGNAATGAPFAGGVLDSRLRGNDGSIHARLADLQGQPFLPVLAPVIAPQTCTPNCTTNHSRKCRRKYVAALADTA